MKKILALLIMIVIFIWLYVNVNAWTVNYNTCKLNNAVCNITQSSSGIDELTKNNVDTILSNFYLKLDKKYNSLYNTQYIYAILIDKIKVMAQKWERYDYKNKIIYYIYFNIEQEYYKIGYHIRLAENAKANDDSKLNNFLNSVKQENNTVPEKNTTNDSFSKSKRLLEWYVYNGTIMERKTVYCGCEYSKTKYVDNTECGYVNDWRYEKRWKKIEWEHIVPAENFGRSFIEWREWDPKCVDSKWKSFSWRSCAEKVNMTYRYMQADMYNLYPAIWALNALRSNYQVAEIQWEERLHWTCDFEVNDRKMEPPTNMKWDIARVYRYMNTTYPWHSMISDKTKKLFEIWEKIDPISKEECSRYKAIKKVQKNINIVLEDKCMNF